MLEKKLNAALKDNTQLTEKLASEESSRQFFEGCYAHADRNRVKLKAERDELQIERDDAVEANGWHQRRTQIAEDKANTLEAAIRKIDAALHTENKELRDKLGRAEADRNLFEKRHREWTEKGETVIGECPVCGNRIESEDGLMGMKCAMGHAERSYEMALPELQRLQEREKDWQATHERAAKYVCEIDSLQAKLERAEEALVVSLKRMREEL